MKLSDEDVDRIAAAVARRLAAPAVPAYRQMTPWMEYPRVYDPFRVTSGTISGSSDGVMYC